MSSSLSSSESLSTTCFFAWAFPFFCAAFCALISARVRGSGSTVLPNAAAFFGSRVAVIPTGWRGWLLGESEDPEDESEPEPEPDSDSSSDSSSESSSSSEALFFCLGCEWRGGCQCPEQ